MRHKEVVPSLSTNWMSCSRQLEVGASLMSPLIIVLRISQISGVGGADGGHEGLSYCDLIRSPPGSGWSVITAAQLSLLSPATHNNLVLFPSRTSPSTLSAPFSSCSDLRRIPESLSVTQELHLGSSVFSCSLLWTH